MKKVYAYFEQALLFLMLFLYILLLGKILFFKYVSPSELFSADRILSRSLNIVPIKSILEYFSSNYSIRVALMNVAGNIVIFIPLGIYLQLFMKDKRMLKGVAIACIISLFVEITQYIFGIGGSDIDDVILNTLGGLLGILIYRIIALICKNDHKIKTTIVFLSAIVGVLGVTYLNNVYPSLLGLHKNVETIVIGEELGIHGKDPDVVGQIISVDGDKLTLENHCRAIGINSKYADGETTVVITPQTVIAKKSIDYNYGPNQMLVTYEPYTYEQITTLKKSENIVIGLHIIDDNGTLFAEDLFVFFGDE